MSRDVEHWLITGSKGQLGTDLQDLLAGTDVTAVDIDTLDLTDAAAVERFVREWASGRAGEKVLLNAAAFTAVDLAEEKEDLALAVNGTATAHLAAACASTGTVLVHVSTDYVFAGDATEPYAEDAAPDPRSAYGRTKLAGERAALESDATAYVVRTAWVYGHRGKNFVKTMARLERDRDRLTVVGDQHGSPTWSWQLAEGLLALARSGAAAGTYHLTGRGETTWHGFAQAVFAELGADPERVAAITTAEYPVPAPRPAYSVLGHQKWDAAGLPAPLPWREALARAFAEHGEDFRAG